MKNKNPILTALILGMGFFLSKMQAQNLVFNGGFEIYQNCPISLNSFCGNSDLPNWICIQTPDYYNSCATTSSWVNVPNATMGYQYAHRGNAFTGLICAQGMGSNSREFIQERLDTTLRANSQYCVSFFVNLADTSEFIASEIGAYFSDTAITPVVFNPSYTLIYFPAQIKDTSFISDTVNWVEVSGIFTANGTENYITIGKFDFDSSTNVQPFDTTSLMPLAYYYVDDVSVEAVLNAEAGNNTSLCLGADSIIIGNNPTENATYSWWPAVGLSDANAANPKASPSVTTTYHVTKTQCSIITTDSVTVTVKDCDSLNIFIPSAFSPNGDGQNDILFVRTNKKLDALDFSVYDRWGELVFHTNDISQGWDGTYHGEKLNNGIFVYACRATIDGQEYFYRGNIAIIK